MASKTFKAVMLIGGKLDGSFTSMLGKTQNGLKGIGKTIGDIERKQVLLGKSIQTFGKMGKNVDGLRERYVKLGKTLDDLKHKQSWQGKIDANASARSATGAKLGSAALALGAAVAPIAASVNGAATFSRESRLIGNTANMTASEVRAMNDEILRTSKASNQSAEDVQRGMGFLIAAGQSAGEARRTIGSISMTATATGADMEDLAKSAFTLSDALKIKPEGIGDALDALAVAGKRGNFELRDMAKALPSVGAKFVALKMSGNEAAATLGAALQIARKGAGSADEAANNMENFMAKVLAPATLKKAQKNFGLDLYAVIQNAQKTGGNPFDAAMQSIMKATGGDVKKLGDMFEDMQVKNFLLPMMQNWDEYKDIQNKALNNSKGAIKKDFTRMMDEPSEKFKAAQIDFHNASLKFGETLFPVATKLTTVFTGLIGKFSEFTEKNPELVAGAAKIGVGLLALRVGGLAAKLAFHTMLSPALKVFQVFRGLQLVRAGAAISSLTGPAARFVPILLKISTFARVAGTAILGLGAAPLAAIVLLGAAAFAVYKNWGAMKEGAVLLAQDIGGALGRLKDSAIRVAGMIGGAFQGAWDYIKTGAAAMVDWVSAKIGWIGEQARKIGTTFTGFFGGGAASDPPPANSRAAQAVRHAQAATASNSTSNRTVNATVNVVQQPGQDSRALAREVAKEIKRQEGVANRSRMTDAVA